jgi:hypothetical protein
MGSSHTSNSTRRRAKKARSAKRQTKASAIPAGIADEIEDRRGDIAGAMALLYGLHSVLKNQNEDAGPVESELLADAIKWVDLTNITGLVLLQLHSIHLALAKAGRPAAPTI